jgi:hypothetical protein
LYYLFVLLYLVVIFFIGAIANQKRSDHPNYPTLSTWVKKLKNKYYFVNRFIVQMKELITIMFVFVPFVILHQIIKICRWPVIAYYFLFLSLPISLVVWVYYPWLKDMNIADDDIRAKSITARRLFVYEIIVIYALIDIYSRFNQLAQHQKINDTYMLIFYSVSAVFLAFERLIRFIIDDYKLFKKEDKQ